MNIHYTNRTNKIGDVLCVIQTEEGYYICREVVSSIPEHNGFRTPLIFLPAAEGTWEDAVHEAETGDFTWRHFPPVG